MCFVLLNIKVSKKLKNVVWAMSCLFIVKCNLEKVNLGAFLAQFYAKC